LIYFIEDWKIDSVSIASEAEFIRIDSARIARNISINNKSNAFVAIKSVFVESIDSESVDAKAVKTVIFSLKTFFAYNSEKISESTVK